MLWLPVAGGTLVVDYDKECVADIRGQLQASEGDAASPAGDILGTERHQHLIEFVRLFRSIALGRAAYKAVQFRSEERRVGKECRL